jgi:DNA-binding Lrp family transcriptional regulator
MDLDMHDIKILSELDYESRQSYASIGKKIGRSKQFVKYRIELLKKSGIIMSATLDLNLRALGYSLFNILLQLQNIDERKEKSIVNYLKNSEYSGYCLKTLGNWDLFISVKANNINDFYKFLGDFHTQFHSLIKKEVINLEVAGISTNMKFLSKNKGTAFISHQISTDKNTDLSEVEKKTIHLLRSNPSIEYLELAKKVGVSYITLVKVIKKLKEEGVMKRTRMAIDTERLGYTRYLFLIDLTYLNYSRMNKLLEYLSNHNKINYIIQCVGSCNLICNAYSKDTKELMQTISDIKNEFSSEIKSMEFLRVVKNEKEIFTV